VHISKCRSCFGKYQKSVPNQLSGALSPRTWPRPNATLKPSVVKRLPEASCEATDTLHHLGTRGGHYTEQLGLAPAQFGPRLDKADSLRGSDQLGFFPIGTGPSVPGGHNQSTSI
jgi:hypothetical protein